METISVARHVLLQAVHVEPLILRRGERLLLAGRARTAEQFLMEGDVFLPAGILHAHRDRDTRGLQRTRSEDRELLEHDLQFRIVLQQSEQIGQRPLAVAAAVVEELDQGDVAVGIAERHLVRRGKQRSRIAGHGSAVIGKGSSWQDRERQCFPRSRRPPADA